MTSNAGRGSDTQDSNHRAPLLPTVTGHRKEGSELILETLDSRPETDLYTDPLERVGETKTEEQKEKLRLWQEN